MMKDAMDTGPADMFGGKDMDGLQPTESDYKEMLKDELGREPTQQEIQDAMKTDNVGGEGQEAQAEDPQ